MNLRYFISVLLGTLAFLSLDAIHTEVIIAQAPLIRATVDKTDLTTDETLTLTITIESEGHISQPVLPSLNEVRILSHKTVRKVSLINGQSSSILTHEYILKPTVDGPLTIDPIQVIINGKAAETNPITIEVHPGNTSGNTSKPSAQDDIADQNLQNQEYLVESTIDDPVPFLGEQITYTFRFYRNSARRRFFQPRPVPQWPSMTGFWSYDSSTLDKIGISTQERSYDTVKYGRKYLVTEVRTFLFPTTVGSRTIEPTKLTIPGGYGRNTVTLESDANTVTTQPLPAGAPSSFNGAVGDFAINVSVDNQSSLYNQPVVLSIMIRGSGNVELLAKPEFPQNREWRSVDDQVTTSFEIENDKLLGTRTYRTSLLPLQTGELVIPSIEFTYFDTLTGTYRTILSKEIPVSVNRKSNQAWIQDDPVTVDKQISRLATDIRHIKPKPDKLDVNRQPIFKHTAYWLVIGLPLPALLAVFMFLKGTKLPFRNNQFASKSTAYKKAIRTLSATDHESPMVYTSINTVTNDYISAKIQHQTAGLTQHELLILLDQHGISASLRQRIKNCLNECDINRFAPTEIQAGSSTRLINEIETAIEELETEFETNLGT